MKAVTQNEFIGEIVYEESFWTGKRTISVNGVKWERSKHDKKEYFHETAEGKEVLTLKGNYLTGISVWYKGRVVEVLSKPTWYEILIAIFPLIFVCIWGNAEPLVMIFPIIGGAIGGFVSALGGATAMLVMRSMKVTKQKILVGCAISLGSIIVCGMLGYILIIALAVALA